MLERKDFKNLAEFSQAHFFERYYEDESFACKKMFGGLALYLNGKMIAMLCDDPKSKEWKKQKFNYALWDGVLFPTDYNHQPELKKIIPEFIQHPILKKWLYLPKMLDSFEEAIEKVLRLIDKDDEKIGILPNLALTRKRKAKPIGQRKIKKLKS